jgi:hypothetical protein
MAKNKTYLSNLLEYAFIYIDECEYNRKEQLSNKGDIIKILERKNPTIDYFLTVWLPKNCKKNKTIHRSTYYRWIKWDNIHIKFVINQIDNLISSVQKDVAANEGKGIQYLKYKFGWADRVDSNVNTSISVLNLDPLDDSKDNLLT